LAKTWIISIQIIATLLRILAQTSISTALETGSNCTFCQLQYTTSRMGVDRYEKVGGTKTDFHWTGKLY